MHEPYKVIPPNNLEIPVVLSVPHCGIEFPKDLSDQFKPQLIAAPDDTDWYVHELYNFGPDLGMTMIHAVYSRWVVDLNRDPESKPLYNDGRIITSLCPTTNFLGESLYKDARTDVDEGEIRRRIDLYYRPYYTQIQRLLDEKKEKFGVALLWDCHSIRQYVPTIHKEKFPDLILGDADGTSASPGLIDAAMREFESSNYGFHHNYPFKGGFITRHFGRPTENQHALQLEMTKINYMDDREVNFNQERAEKVRSVLMKALTAVESVLQP